MSTRKPGLWMNRGVGMGFSFRNGITVSALVGQPDNVIDCRDYEYHDERGNRKTSCEKVIVNAGLENQIAHVVVYDEWEASGHDDYSTITNEYRDTLDYELRVTAEELIDVLIWAKNYR